MVPGQRMIVGSRIPPSYVLNLPLRSGSAQPPFLPFESHGPLSEVYITSVSRASPSFFTAARICPVLQSISSITSP